jgi:bifunctional non-homologous end joining protein LigD
MSPRSTANNTAGTELIPARGKECEVQVGGRVVRLTNLHKPFWPRMGSPRATCCATTSPFQWLLPHLRGRAMVMKRYPNGYKGPFFFMKRTPPARPSG